MSTSRSFRYIYSRFNNPVYRTSKYISRNYSTPPPPPPPPRPPPSHTKRYLKYVTWPTVGLGVFIIGFEWYMKSRGRAQAAELIPTKNDFGLVPSRPDLPTFTLDQVSSHNATEKRIWVAYGGGVYDITDFVNVHPGGQEKIKLAYGGPLEPFWALYAVHKKSEVLEILEEMRIGNLDSASMAKIMEDMKNDPFADDPPRHAALMPCSIKPFNAETPPEMMPENFLTPNEVFFVRNHLPVPNIDIGNYYVEIGGVGLPNRRYTLDELKRKFPSVTVTAAIQCAGNRRNEMNPLKQVKGLTWGFTAISNAKWTGVRLSDVLADLGLTDSRIQRNEGVWAHVQFEGHDSDPTGQRYGASIPIDKAVDRKGDVILAYEMNGEPLPRDHGFPLRVVVPGIVGARNVKWLAKVFVSDKESSSHWQQNDYKSFSPSTDWDTVDFKSAPAIQEAPIQSAICSPLNGEEIPKGSKEVQVQGYAWSGGGRGVIRVDVSADGGKTWKTAELQQDKSQALNRMWAWSLWSCKLPITKEVINSNGTVQLMCKATDMSYNSQPDNVAGIWNLRGVLNNAWHRVSVKVEG